MALEISFTPEELALSGFASFATDRAALDHLFSVTYEELRRLASLVRRRDPGATLSPTTLVNEAWIKLARTPAVAQLSDLHFKRIAARAMRQVLIAAARKRNAGKRSAGPGMSVTFHENLSAGVTCDEELLALDVALEELAKMNPRQALLVEGRFFGGLEVAEITRLLGVSEATVLRDWRVARAWLAQQLDRQLRG
ncbi:ECF-type sigma factor [Bryobacter aggregatus]|uniref:ECF-type sigma factor n=1 Tax=Bryobacter aggregatus TaxID=360054 RepID=UPI0004E1EE28|nr:ECF-type sigma factor [Bryobacter aggregatus]